MKKFIIFLLCVAVIGGGSFFGYKKYMADKKEKVVVDVVPVSLMMIPAEWYDYSMDSMYGEVVASSAQRVNVDTDKLVKEVFVEVGQQVKKGDPILEYDMTVVELSLAQKENKVRVLEQDIKMAQKELENIRNYKPIEDAPQPPEPEIPDLPEDFGFPDMELPDGMGEELPPEPPQQLVTDIVKPAFIPAEGDGTAERPFIINCTLETEVSEAFMTRIFSEKRCAEICVYDSEYYYLYKWIIAPGEEAELSVPSSWSVADGITIDEEGQVSIDTSVTHFGKLSFTRPTSEIVEEPPMEELPEDYEEEDPEDYEEEPEYDPDDLYFDPNGTDYVFTREDIKDMIEEQENMIKDLELDLKLANFELEAAKKQKRDGKLFAEIDGYVKKIGKASGEEDPEEEEEEDIYEEPSADDKAFAVIEGEGGTEVICMVSEYDLDKMTSGRMLNVTCWRTGALGTAEVSYVEDTPRSYGGYGGWGENPQRSTYILHAKLLDEDSFSLGDDVDVSMGGSSEEVSSSNSVYLPIHYVRQEGGDHYIMKADEDGKLTKQYVKAGKVMWGMYIEIKGGLNAKDRICFPYGKDVKEGVKTRETGEVLQPEGFYY